MRKISLNWDLKYDLSWSRMFMIILIVSVFMEGDAGKILEGRCITPSELIVGACQTNPKVFLLYTDFIILFFYWYIEKTLLKDSRKGAYLSMNDLCNIPPLYWRSYTLSPWLKESKTLPCWLVVSSPKLATLGWYCPWFGINGITKYFLLKWYLW